MKNALKKVTASVVTLMFALGLSLVAVTPASAEAFSNQPKNWQTPGEVCALVDNLSGQTWTLPAGIPAAGFFLTKVIVKAGDSKPAENYLENTVYYQDAKYMITEPVVTAKWIPVQTWPAEFTPAGKYGISHVIYCSAETPATPSTPVLVTPKVDFTQITCDARGSYTLGAVEGVVYTVNGTVEQPGTYPELDTLTVMVTATADASKYKLAPDVPSEFPFSFVKPTNCGSVPSTPVLVTPKVDFTQITCDASGSYTLGAVEGVVYKVDGTVQQPGTYSVSDASTVVVTATADALKYKLTPGAPSEFPFTFSAAEECQLPPHGLLTPKASSTPITCTTAGSYTLVNDEGLIWLVDGVETPAGTYNVSQASAVRVVATTDPTKAGLEAGAQTEWTFTFTKPICQLTTLALPESNGTLAFTGSNGTLAGGLLLGLIFMVVGAGAMTVSSVRRRTS